MVQLLLIPEGRSERFFASDGLEFGVPPNKKRKVEGSAREMCYCHIYLTCDPRRLV